MARVIRGQGGGDVSFNMTPLIDIVFNLIIFFMLVSQFQQLEIEDVTLPVAYTATSKDYTQHRNVVINIVNPDNPEIIVMGKPKTIIELTEYLKAHREGASEKEELNVILRADAMIPYEDIARVMLAAGQAQIPGWWMTTEIGEKEGASQP